MEAHCACLWAAFVDSDETRKYLARFKEMLEQLGESRAQAPFS